MYNIRAVLLLLVLLSLYIDRGHGFTFFRPIHRPAHGHRLFMATTSPYVAITLGQSFQLENFFELYKERSIQGVFAIEDSEGKVKLVDSSLNVLPAVQEHIKQHCLDTSDHVIRVQSFDISNKDMASLMKVYETELIRQTNPVIKNEKVEIVSPFSAEAPIVSPFAGDLVTELDDDDDDDDEDFEYETSPKIAPSSGEELELTVANVDKILDEVRPFLIADGGNVAVIGVDASTRGVELCLEGACGSCPSSTTTMKMGIERVLNENFANLGPVTNVEKKIEELTIEAVQGTFEKLLPAIKGLGGVSVIKRVDGATGTVTIGFSGPARLKQGIEMALRDNKLVQGVVFEAVE